MDIGFFSVKKYLPRITAWRIHAFENGNIKNAKKCNGLNKNDKVLNNDDGREYIKGICGI